MSRIKPRTSTYVVLDGDVWEQLDELRAKAEQAEAIAEVQNKNGASVRADEAVDPLSAWEAYADAVDAANADGLKVVLNDIGSGRWRDLVAQHPPRDGNRRDQQLGYDTDRFPAALLGYVDHDTDRRTIVEPVMSELELKAFLRDISDSDLEAMYVIATNLNRAQAADPKDVRSLIARRSSNET
ncbi:hypothetical protein [Nocardioides sp. ChNu-99]|uniref:hypothetical protein n=1 Tax=Nocardioides sp. ChNu-99 TaxID=2839897 RepID=UPI002406AB19|nr:hypothetical protein [Nocardioides sp. ChNu-99]MDF9718036.1 hypothetical protein [Nocardioides sp. ChNu-99]